MQAFISGSWRTIVNAKAYINGAWQTPTTAKAYIGAAWRDVATFVLPMSLAITPNPFNFRDFSSTISGSLTATPSGGLGPFTYNWTVLSGSSLTITNGTMATATVTANGVAEGSPVSGSFQCAVTDTLGSTATASASGTFVHRTSLGGGGGTF